MLKKSELGTLCIIEHIDSLKTGKNNRVYILKHCNKHFVLNHYLYFLWCNEKGLIINGVHCRNIRIKIRLNLNRSFKWSTIWNINSFIWCIYRIITAIRLLSMHLFIRFLQKPVMIKFFYYLNYLTKTVLEYPPFAMEKWLMIK